ncbi:MAG: TfoX/Sxy family protein [Hyphomonadaceae bacterium]
MIAPGEDEALAYDELLAMRVRDALGGIEGLSEKRMMGGVCFMLDGNMICGADRTKAGARRFMFRIGKDNPVAAKLRGGEVVAMGDSKMPGFYFVDEARCADKEFKAWLAAALAFARSLPPK